MKKSVADARAFAVAAHGEQKYAGQPYVVHLDRVAGYLEVFGEEAQVVGYLHDVVEDTAVGAERVRVEFGEHVAACVLLVTDVAGANRAERKVKTNAKLAKVGKELELALIVKAADRLANLRQGVEGGSVEKLAMYRGEHPAFRAAAYREGLCEGLWVEIERIIGGVM